MAISRQTAVTVAICSGVIVRPSRVSLISTSPIDLVPGDQRHDEHRLLPPAAHVLALGRAEARIGGRGDEDRLFVASASRSTAHTSRAVHTCSCSGQGFSS